MRWTLWVGIFSALGWFFFPLVPAFLGSTYNSELNWSFGARGGPDPRDWTWDKWIILTGPLIGFGFLAGATLNLPDDPTRRGFRGWFSKRSLWVAIGPWVGLLVWEGVKGRDWIYPPSLVWLTSLVPSGVRWTPWVAWVLGAVVLFGPVAYGWLPFAWAALRRAKRLDRLGQSLVRGLGVAFGFVGSLFGSFWAITETWRTYFFDPRIMPALLAASTLVVLSGCAGPETYGEVRRRELFQAMLLAWLLGLGFVWRWWSRSKPKPPGPST